MRRFQEARRAARRRRVLFWAVIVCVAWCTFVLGRAAWRMREKEALARARFEEGSAEVAALAGREKELRDALADLGDERGIEKELRRKFRVAREGEQLVVVEQGGQPEEPHAPAQESLSLFGWLRQLVRGITSEQYTRE